MDRKTKETVKLFDDAALHYQEKYMDVSPYKNMLTLLCENIRMTNPKILDIASGPGNVAKFIIDRIPSSSITCTDLSPAMLELAQTNIPSAKVKLIDARKILEMGHHYDIIVASFIFPYFTKEEVIQFIIYSKIVLNPNGLLYISTMVGNNEDSGYISSENRPPIYMNWHEESYIKDTLEESGFDILESKIQPYDYDEDNRGNDLLIIARLG